jgi:hypothetical protein
VLTEIRKLAEQLPRDELVRQVKERFGLDEAELEFVLGAQRETDYKPHILKLIESLDEGEGVEISRIFELSDLPEHVIERAIGELLAEGSIYEPQPTVYKKV